MNVLIIGSGNMGAAFAKQLHAAGHSVLVTSRDAAKAAALAAQHPGVHALPPQQAAQRCDVVVLATGFADAVAALHSVGSLAGKTVIDITNPLSADYMSLSIGHSTSAAEEIARAVPEAHVVKAFNTLFAQVLANGADFGNDRKASVFVAADNERAKATTKSLAQSMGFDAVDAGGLKNARYLEPLAGLNIYFGYGAGLGTNIAPMWISKK